jgi:acyl-CoA synthetase (AMP-forming)/AMP-acid ligase II
MGVLQRQTVQDVPHGRRLLPVLVDELRPERIFARIPKSSHLQDGLIDVNCQTFARAINRAAGWLEDTLGKSSSFETVAYFGPSDLRYLIFVLGASKVGYKASNLQCFSCLYHELSNIQGGQLLLPSPRNSLEGQLSLLGTTDCKAILGPEGYNFQHGLLEKSNLPVFRVGELLDLLAEGEVRQYKFDKTFDNAKDDPIVVLHTSGSTGLPKPIVISHGWIASFDNQKNLGTFNGYPPICTAYFARRIFCSVPPFHVCASPPRAECDTSSTHTDRHLVS